jgi:hypothetical protein
MSLGYPAHLIKALIEVRIKFERSERKRTPTIDLSPYE